MSTRFIPFSPSEDEILIECVAKHPALYDSCIKDYKDQTIRENIWKEISEKVERNVADCKKRWRSIRDTYMKQKKTIGPTGSAGKCKSKWPLLEHLGFLNKVSYERSSQSNVGLDESQRTTLEDDEDHEPPEIQSEAGPSTPSTSHKNVEEVSSENVKKRKRLRSSNGTPKRSKDNSDKILEMLEKRSAEREQLMRSFVNRNSDDSSNAVSVFFKSIAMTVNTFRPELIAEAKARICGIVSELEIRSLEDKQPQPPLRSLSRPETSLSDVSDVGSYYSNFSPLADFAPHNDSNLTHL